MVTDLRVRVSLRLTILGTVAELGLIGDVVPIRVFAKHSRLGCDINLSSQGVVGLREMHDAAWVGGLEASVRIPRDFEILDAIPLVVGVVVALAVQHVLEVDLVSILWVACFVDGQQLVLVMFGQEIPVLEEHVC
jgi:hypothetical protein